LKAIVFHYGPLIEELAWDSCMMTATEATTLLNYLPNLKKLSLMTWKLAEQEWEEPNVGLNLNNLTQVELVRNCRKTVEFLANSLPPNIILDMNYKGDAPDSLLSNQSSIRKLNLRDINLDGNEFLHSLNLTDFTLSCYTFNVDSVDINIENIVLHQPALVYLDLLGCPSCFEGNFRGFAAICNLEHLRHLKINHDDLGLFAFMEHCSKLRKLESLCLEADHIDDTNSILGCLSEMETDNLEKLEIFCRNIIQKEIFERMGHNFTNLKSITLRYERPLPLTFYLTVFKKLESLNVDYQYTIEFSKFYTNRMETKCLLMKELTLSGFVFGSNELDLNWMTLLELVDIMPNLETLSVDANFNFNIDLVKHVMNECKQLKILNEMSYANWRQLSKV